MLNYCHDLPSSQSRTREDTKQAGSYKDATESKEMRKHQMLVTCRKETGGRRQDSSDIPESNRAVSPLNLTEHDRAVQRYSWGVMHVEDRMYIVS